MKTFIWVVIIAALIFGGYKLFKGSSAETETKTETVPAAATRAVFPESTPGKPNSEKGIKNWRAIKKVRNLSDQHQKDLQDNM